MSDVSYALVFVALLVASAGFSAIETAYFSLSQLRLKKLEEEGHPHAAPILALLADKQSLLMSLLLGKTLANVAATVLATRLSLRWLETAPWSEAIPFASPNQTGVIIAALIMTLIILLIGEIVPKTIAIQHALRLASFTLLPLRVLLLCCTPFTVVVAGGMRLFFPAGANWNEKMGSTISMEEIDTYFSLGEEAGIIASDEKEMISSVFEFGDTIVREVMKPRLDVRALPLSANIDEVLKMIREEGHSRIPVFSDNIDKIEGILYIKDLFMNYDVLSTDFALKKYVRPAYFVPETKKLDDLLREFQKRKIHLAIVVDEFGGTSGIVTLEDLLEEIVGEIADEFDTEEPPIVRCEDRSLMVHSHVAIRDIEDELVGINHQRLGEALCRQWKFPHLDELWAGPEVLRKLGKS